MFPFYLPSPCTSRFLKEKMCFQGSLFIGKLRIGLKWFSTWSSLKNKSKRKNTWNHAYGAHGVETLCLLGTSMCLGHMRHIMGYIEQQVGRKVPFFFVFWVIFPHAFILALMILFSHIVLPFKILMELLWYSFSCLHNSMWCLDLLIYTIFFTNMTQNAYEIVGFGKK